MSRPSASSFTHVSRRSDVHFGLGTADPQGLTDTAERLGYRRLMAVAGGSGEQVVHRLESFGGDLVVGRFGDVVRHVPSDVARAARRMAQACEADALLAIGGGSAIGTAKAVALELELPIIAVPTTYAGSEVTAVWGVTVDGRKQTGVDARVLPRCVVYDPSLTIDLPVGLSISSGLNALAHCLEAIWTLHGDPIAGVLAAEGTRSFAAALPTIATHPDDLDARTEALYAAWLAGASFALSGSGLHHKICHALGGAYDLPHADLHAVILPHATALATRDHPAIAQRITDALGSRSDDAAEAVQDLVRRLDAPRSLTEIGFPAAARDEALAIVERAVSQLTDEVSPAELEILLDRALAR